MRKLCNTQHKTSWVTGYCRRILLLFLVLLFSLHSFNLHQNCVRQNVLIERGSQTTICYYWYVKCLQNMKLLCMNAAIYIYLKKHFVDNIHYIALLMQDK